MEIDYVYMKNFRQYQDVKIEFPRSPPKNFTVIIGANGAGKTNLLNAMTWCLFGEELHKDSKYAGLPLLNTSTLDETKEGVSELSVEFQLIQNDGKKFKITRTKHFKKKARQDPVEVPQAKTLSVLRETERDWVGPIHDAEAQYLIDNLIPRSIEEYFFFDGERLDDYFKDQTGKDIRMAVFRISQLELFETLIYHLTRRKIDSLKKARGLGDEAESIREMIELQTRSLESDKVIFAELQAKKTKAEQNEQVYSKKLKSSSLERIQILEDRRVDLENEITRMQDEIEDTEAQRLKTLHQYMPIVFAHNALLKTERLIDSRREAGLIPPLYQTIFIQNLLRKGKCICDSDITGKNEFSLDRRNKVEAFLEIGKLSDMSSGLIETNIHIKGMLDKLKSFPETEINLSKTLKNLRDTKAEKNKAIRTISQEIEQSNVENIKMWGKERQRYSNEVDQLKIKIAMQEKQIERRENIIRANNVKLNQELRKQRRHSELLRKLAFCDEAIECANKIRDDIMKKVKDDIEKRTSQQFLDLIWKKNTYEGVKIDDNYNISVPHISGREALGTLSAGERQVCALSFMAALNSVSGFGVPLIIDTPLARISREPRRNIAMNLPNYLEGTQVTLLVTEEEYTPEVRNQISKRVGKTYAINFLERERGSLAEVDLIE